jgi:outer membrane lipoprotein-sorting protein
MRAHALFAVAAGALLCLPAHAQTLDEVIAKNLAARGGKDKITAVQTMRVKGTMTMGPGMEAPFTMEWKAPNHLRLEFTIQGQTGVQAYDGTTAWMYMPFMGKTEPEKMAPEQTADMEQQADMLAGPLVDYQKKGHSVRLVGKRDVEGTEAYDLEITMKNGDVVHELIDAESNLSIKEEMKHKQGDQEMEAEQSIGNYKSVGGLVLPHSMETHPKGAPAGTPGQTITIESYELGVPVDDARFAMPEKAPAAAKPAG